MLRMLTPPLGNYSRRFNPSVGAMLKGIQLHMTT